VRAHLFPISPVPESVPLSPRRRRVAEGEGRFRRDFLGETTCPVPCPNWTEPGSLTTKTRRTPSFGPENLLGDLGGLVVQICSQSLSEPDRERVRSGQRHRFTGRARLLKTTCPDRIAAHRSDADRWDSHGGSTPLISIVRDPSRRDHFRRTRRDNLSRRAGDLFLPCVKKDPHPGGDPLSSPAASSPSPVRFANGRGPG